jgi:hypothetical protein
MTCATSNLAFERGPNSHAARANSGVALGLETVARPILNRFFSAVRAT